MNWIHPTSDLYPGLRLLWQEAFRDSDAFLDHFWRTGFASERCLCAEKEGAVCAALYWFDCFCDGKKLAYLYAVATKKSHRGQGLCRQLMAKTLTVLKGRGYAGALLCPENEGLFAMYRKMGFCGQLSIREFTVLSGETSVALRSVDSAEYARLRREYLPAGGVVQDGESLAFLEGFASFYAGTGFLLAARQEDDRLFAMELLGDTAFAPGILTALNAAQGNFRTPGDEKPFALYAPLNDPLTPDYFGLAFD